MPTLETIENFIARVEQNAHVEAIEEFYAIGASMQENQLPPRVGRDTLVAHERMLLAKLRTVKSKCIRPALFDDEHAMLRWAFEFEWLDGRKNRMEEIAWQRWKDERIVEETFFYDPAQLTAARPDD